MTLGEAITPLSPHEQAFDYPYAAPDEGYLLSDGAVHPLCDMSLLGGRIAVLSVGSNRAPRQLFKKFGAAATVPVTPAKLLDFDICHVANIAPYGAIPCAAFPSPETSVHLNIAWLERAQLAKMHATESLGDAYAFIRWHSAQIQHQMPIQLSVPIYGYASLSGMLPFSDSNTPNALAAIRADGRVFSTATQEMAMRQAQSLSGIAPDLELSDWVQALCADKQMRTEFVQAIARHALGVEAHGWDVMTDLLI